MHRRSAVIPGSPLANAALVAALKESGEWDEIVSGRGLRPTPVKTVGPPPKPPPRFYIAPFDSSSFVDPPERDQQRGLDPEQLEEQLRAARSPEPAEHPPAKRRPWQRRTP